MSKSIVSHGSRADGRPSLEIDTERAFLPFGLRTGSITGSNSNANIPAKKGEIMVNRSSPASVQIDGTKDRLGTSPALRVWSLVVR